MNALNLTFYMSCALKLYQANGIAILFGDKQLACNPKEFWTGADFNQSAQAIAAKELLGARKLFFMQQVHGHDGLTIGSYAQITDILPFALPGDYIITDQPLLGIGVMTADCVPLVLHDTVKKLSAVVHAGWRGTVSQIAIQSVKQLQKLGSSIYDLQVFVGPSAQLCCYQVTPEFKQYNDSPELYRAVQGKLYFDVPGLNIKQLRQYGLASDQIVQDFGVCTICTDGYCSYRKEPGQAARQMTIVMHTYER